MKNLSGERTVTDIHRYRNFSRTMHWVSIIPKTGEGWGGKGRGRAGWGGKGRGRVGEGRGGEGRVGEGRGGRKG